MPRGAREDPVPARVAPGAQAQPRGAGAGVDRTEARALAMVLLGAPAAISTASLAASWRHAWPDLPEPRELAHEEDEHGVVAVTLDLGGMTGAVALIRARVPGADVERAAVAARLWPEAGADLSHVQAHLVVWVTGAGTPPDAHRHLTRLVTAVLRATPALGVYSGAAGIVVRAEQFDELAHAYGDRPAVLLWVGFDVVADGARTGLATTGLREFGLRELEIEASSRPLNELYDLAATVASYLIEAGPVVGDGDTIGRTEHERLVVRHARSMFDRPGVVYRITGF